MEKIIVGITAPKSIVLITGQMKWFKEQGYKTYLMCPNDPLVEDYCKNEECEHIPIAIEREIRFIKDLKSLCAIYKSMRKIKPDVVNVGTPKMGFLGMLVAKFLKVKRRIYTCRGFRYEHEKGLKRKILIFMEKLSGFCAQDIICISPSLRELGIKDKVFSPEKCVVINKGSSNGINLSRFSSMAIDKFRIVQLKKELRLEEKFVFGFIGRLVDRKGIKEMYNAFVKVNNEYPYTRLLIVGATELEQIDNKELVADINNHPSIIMTGRQKEIPLYLSVMDIFLLPAWWEGFGNVLIQAAAMGIAVISTTGTGTKDAVCDGFNGILVPIKDTEALYKAMIKLMNNSEERERLSNNGIEWAKNFSNEIIWQGMNDLYK